MTTTECFWAKVDVRGGTECWLWRAATWNGYGKVWFRGARTQAHRVAYELGIGLIPHGFEIDHLCRNRTCCNPAHLEAVTHAENMRRGGHTIRTHCIHGHEFTPENTQIRRTRQQPFHRVCKACAVIRSRKSRARRRARNEAAEAA